MACKRSQVQSLVSLVKRTRQKVIRKISSSDSGEGTNAHGLSNIVKGGFKHISQVLQKSRGVINIITDLRSSKENCPCCEPQSKKGWRIRTTEQEPPHTILLYVTGRHKSDA